MKNYRTIVGMEIHVELKTNSKMFCGCKNDPFYASKPNIYTCPTCLGMPGGLPVPNKKAIEWCLTLGMALNCEIPKLSKFDRKNYFYPDLAKGYQISQYDQPFCKNGYVMIEIVDPDTKKILEKKIRINRVHLEEDTAKLLHQNINGKNVSLIDFNRSGVPLVEIVTEPDIESGEEVKIFLKKLHQIIRYLGISDADMEKGSMRLEPNISIQRQEDKKTGRQEDKLPNYKVEVKNINSFNFVKKAIEYEVERQIVILAAGETPKQETRGWDEKKNVTLPQRSKEGAEDYRYFPEPDIPPFIWDESFLGKLRKNLPELPEAKLIRFAKTFGLPYQDCERLTENKDMAEYFEKAISYQLSDISYQLSAKDIANWLLNKNIDIKKIKPEDLVKQVIKTKNVVLVDNDKLQLTIDEVLANNQKAVSDYKSGKTGVIMFLVGGVMRELKGQANAQLIKKLLEKELK